MWFYRYLRRVIEEGNTPIVERMTLIMDKISELQASITAENATIDQIAAAVATVDADLVLALASVKNMPDLSPAAVTAVNAAQASITAAQAKTAAILAALQSADPNTLPKPTPSAVTTSLVPATGSTGVSLSSAVVATFSGAVNPATLNGTNFTLKVGGIPVAYNVTNSADNLSATLTPSSPLSPSSSYSASLSGVMDAAGNPVAAVNTTFNT